MDITVTRTRKTFYQVDNTLAALLLEALPGEFERVERPAPAPRPTEPQWGVGHTASERACIVLDLPSGEKRLYTGSPDEAEAGFQYRHWSGQMQAYVIDGPVPPKGIVEQYRLLWTPRPPAQ